MKGALVQTLRGREFLNIVDWIESPYTKLTGKEEMDEIMQQAVEESDVPQHEKTYRK